MSIDVYQARRQRRELNEYIQVLLNTKQDMDMAMSQINNAWVSTEINSINSYIEGINKDITLLINELERLGEDIVYVAEEIKKEEEFLRN